MPNTVILLRHGQTDFNRQRRVQGQIDIALNADGEAQARAAARALALLRPSRVVSSDLTRAVDTARIVADHCGLDVEVDQRLRERAFGDLEGLSLEEMTRDFADQYREWKRTGECAAAGIENRRDVGQRIATAVEELTDETDGVILVVSHGSALTQGMVTLLGLDASAWQGIAGVDNCHWSVLTRATRPPYWRLTAHNLGAAPLR